MKKQLFYALVAACTLIACSDDEDLNAYDSFKDWQARNETWFAALADKARSDAGNWTMYCSTALEHGSTLNDSVLVRYVQRGDGDSPCFNDTVYINYRGWLMPTTYRIDGDDTTLSVVFDQSFYGRYDADDTTPFDDGTAAAAKACVGSYITGFATALQHMHVGDQAHIYIPQQLGYGAQSSNGAIPAYSTLHFFVHLKDIKKAGEEN